MAPQFTDTKPAAILETELKELIIQSRKFSQKLKSVARDCHVDIHQERKATRQVLQLILQKWIIEIIHILFIEETQRFNDLKRNLRGISSRTLTSKLRSLEDAGFVERKLTGERPTIVEYTLTERGQILAELSTPIICHLKLECTSDR
ncbi:MAG: winged helix-turn-helix transcriptional regulator [Candidatus Hydrothermarchaeales archaeon]